MKKILFVVVFFQIFNLYAYDNFDFDTININDENSLPIIEEINNLQGSNITLTLKFNTSSLKPKPNMFRIGFTRGNKSFSNYTTPTAIYDLPIKFAENDAFSVNVSYTENNFVHECSVNPSAGQIGRSNVSITVVCNK